MATRRIQNRPPSALQAEQKIAFALLVFLGFGGIIFGFRSFGSHLYRPIQQQFAKYYTGEDVVNPNAKDSKEIEEQKKKDTDIDGLSDYDELYVYKTSPYLRDSDSDATDDKTEVFAGTDPNCPVGKNCVSLGETANVDSTSPQDFLGSTPGNEAILQSGQLKFQNKEDVQKFFKAATATEIRAALIQSGVKKEEVDKISDEDLQKLFEQAIGQASAEGKFDSLTTGGASGSASATTETSKP
ncbi:hypothetical protein A3C09_01010 [Candidatus Uhrbacteria bacterium RIFCSPHIGHO2_02_FULL_47_44]|uniref:Uncharacterized protein n=1 Tax=Candidatus Uhrbacteria bacterium RIFCSPLOWO2_02_FULL_48_18 TaxID=1802408 RepID=A0A1F7V6U6_9BACT|nr:MAG: hypothetical protein A2839_01315 [Candidatus Uhrbacteria bacterium RIFCSPHIGHO2_01_FULL_47_10]OGL69979.1 MAG: hypothetical protein A3C09_01010 [Candidatus Uhrbacteria bacterium RIFCSPHIGHO2_02_FULL_47_44]OGL76064.1 MAG: hypothetical protein A3E97_02160 [Candidatus Uhrbacteria bacterium RIFCSPHIGHO2_12_FULL_47_12]OGL80344.1 MAG: hypothetical protein A3B20_02870 [Candidatus Uhrbacteria bacterium RIFCSPLOWO2_01_FULL_47_17]OGL86203.1 MAG: hypothetical protein A3I41_01360 [Candidatus Uhrbact